MNWQWTVITVTLLLCTVAFSALASWKETKVKEAETLLTLRLEELRQKERNE